MKQELKYVGKEILKGDARSKVLGTAVYPDDIEFPEMLYGGVVRSTIAYGKILNIDYEATSKMDNVVAIIDSSMIPGEKYHGVVLKDQPVLVSDIVKRVGDPILLIIARDKDTLKKAISKVKVTYEEYKGVFNVEDALAEDAPILSGNSNILYTLKVKKGNVEDAFERCKYIAENWYNTQTIDHAFMQPEAAVAIYEGDILRVYVATQYAHYDKEEVVRCLNLPEDKVEIRNTTIGGAFGGREDMTLQLHAALATYYTKKPVKIVYNREESTVTHCKRHAIKMYYKTGCDENGKLLAQKVRIYGDTGAYCSWGMNVLRKSAVHASGPYNVENVDVESNAVYTNNSFCGAMRGFGALQVNFAYESQMNILCEKLHMHPLKFMYMNCLKEGSITATGQVMKGSVGLPECIEKMAKIDNIEVI